MAAISLSYLTSAVNARALLRFLLSSRATHYRLASTLTRYGVFACRAALVAFLGLMLAFSIAPELFLAGGAE